MTIIVTGFDPSSYIGFAKVSRLILNSLIGLEHKVVFFGIDTQKAETNQQGTLIKYPVKAFPEIAPQINADLIISIGDLWLYEYVIGYINQTPVPWVAYMGCEGISYPSRVYTNANEYIDLSAMLSRISAIWAYTDHSKAKFQGFSETHTLNHALPPDFDKFKSKLDLRKSLKIPSDKKIALYVGDNNARKGIPDFINSVANKDGWVGYIHALEWKECGYDLHDYCKNILNIYRRNQLEEATNYRSFSDDDIKAIYSQADLYLHPHLAEGFGLTILEALATPHLRVLATNTAGPSTYLPDKCKIPVSEPVWLQMGRVGYFGEKPVLVTDLEAGDKYFNMAGYRYSDFKERVKSLLELEYKPKFWRSL